MPDPLPLPVDSAWLAAHIDDPDLRVIDATWYLPASGRDARAEYRAAHLPGAVYVDLSTDLADTKAPVRNTVATPRDLARTFARLGIGTDHRVVVYDRLGGYSAGRVWWTLRLAGHDAVSLLDGGFDAWVAAGNPVTTERPGHGPATFEARPRRSILRDRARVEALLAAGGAPNVVDAREADRFRGEGAEPAKRKGHIPGSVNVPWDANLTDDPAQPPRLLSRAELRARYEAAGVDFERPVIASCGSGVTASLTAFALAVAGHDDVAVYDGSWAEWGNADDTPVETGS